MTEMPATAADTGRKSNWPDFHHTGPGTLAGRYMRMFWQPIYHGEDLKVGRAKPVKIMNVQYTLYRGEDGTPHLTEFRCPHRGLQLSAGWVEGNSIRCFYHGWKFDGGGQCVEQPAEPRPFTDRVKIKTYPCKEYLGLIFAFLGETEGSAVPPFPRYPDFEDFEGILELDSYFRGCNYFNNLENGGDLTHSGFAHRNNPGSFDGFTNAPIIEAKESIWGVTVFAKWPDQVATSQIGMPNIFHHKAQPTDLAMAVYREFMAWWVPHDDHSHTQFTVAAVRMPADKTRAYLERRETRLEKRTQSSMELSRKVLSGEIDYQDIDPETTDFVRLQDHIAQIGQGTIPDFSEETLGQGDRGVTMIRRMWARELRNLAEGGTLKHWKYDSAELSISRGQQWEERRAQQM